MSMTLDEMKLAVCEKLAGAVYKDEAWTAHGYRWSNTNKEINWPTEGLQVCHEAEKLLTDEEYMRYGEIICNGETTIQDARNWISATYEQRLEALCRVWFPEKWKD